MRRLILLHRDTVFCVCVWTEEAIKYFRIFKEIFWNPNISSIHTSLTHRKGNFTLFEIIRTWMKKNVWRQRIKCLQSTMCCRLSFCHPSLRYFDPIIWSIPHTLSIAYNFHRYKRRQDMNSPPYESSQNVSKESFYLRH